MRRAKQKASQVASILFWSLIIAIAGVLTLRFVPTLGNQIPFHTFIVQSGSMEPSIMTGDLIVAMAKDDYPLNTTITFRDSQRRIVTHRIVEIQPNGSQQLFVTKGDANRTTDTQIIQKNAIIGAVVLTIPKIGFAANFARTPLGVMAFVVIPATIIIYDEVKQLVRTK